MPTYDYEILSGDRSGKIVEVFQSMKDKPLRRLPDTGERVRRCYTSFPAFIPPQDWSSENGGRGRYISQMADDAKDQNAYFQSPNDVVEQAKRRGISVEKV